MISEQIQTAARLLGICPKTLPQMTGEEQALVPKTSEERPSNDMDLTDDEYLEIAPFLPGEPRQVGAIPNRIIFNALLHLQISARPFTHLPQSFGSREAIRKRIQRWSELQVGEALLQALDGLALRPKINSTIKRCACDLALRGEKIRKSRESGR